MAKREPACVVCGCTWTRACVYGCSWAKKSPPVCDRCASLEPFVLVEQQGRRPSLRGTVLVVGPGPDGSKDVIYERAADREAAVGLAKSLNRAFRLGWKLNAALTAKPATKRAAKKGGRR